MNPDGAACILSSINRLAVAGSCFLELELEQGEGVRLSGHIFSSVVNDSASLCLSQYELGVVLLASEKQENNAADNLLHRLSYEMQY